VIARVDFETQIHSEAGIPNYCNCGVNNVVEEVDNDGHHEIQSDDIGPTPIGNDTGAFWNSDRSIL